MHPVIFLDHSDTRATVLNDLIDVGSLHQPHADIRVPYRVQQVASMSRNAVVNEHCASFPYFIVVTDV
jgi:hypothetical protein